MKKIFALFIALFGLCCFNCVNATEEPTEVTFIYINGSNNLAYKNRLKFQINFEENVKKLHPQIKKRFEENKLINEVFLQNGKYIINRNFSRDMQRSSCL